MFYHPEQKHMIMIGRPRLCAALLRKIKRKGRAPQMHGLAFSRARLWRGELRAAARFFDEIPA